MQKQKAEYAVQVARQDGLPTNAVLCADIESSQQRGLGTYVNSLAIEAMKQIVESAGYRFDVYSMSSWGDSVIPWEIYGLDCELPIQLNS